MTATPMGRSELRPLNRKGDLFMTDRELADLAYSMLERSYVDRKSVV